MKMSLTIVEIWFSFSAGFSCYEVYFLILQWFLNATNATFKKTIHMPLWLRRLKSRACAYVPSLFQHLLNHTSISGEGPNWHNILFKFNVSCKIDYYAKDPMSICIWTKECSCRIFFYWISFRSRQVFSFAPEQKAKKLSVRFCLPKSWR